MFSQKMHLKMLPGNWWSFCLGLNVLSQCIPLPVAVSLYSGHITGQISSHSSNVPFGKTWWTLLCTCRSIALDHLPTPVKRASSTEIPCTGRLYYNYCSIANALELYPFCTNPSTYTIWCLPWTEVHNLFKLKMRMCWSRCGKAHSHSHFTVILRRHSGWNKKYQERWPPVKYDLRLPWSWNSHVKHVLKLRWTPRFQSVLFPKPSKVKMKRMFVSNIARLVHQNRPPSLIGRAAQT